CAHPPTAASAREPGAKTPSKKRSGSGARAAHRRAQVAARASALLRRAARGADRRLEQIEEARAVLRTEGRRAARQLSTAAQMRQEVAGRHVVADAVLGERAPVRAER